MKYVSKQLPKIAKIVSDNLTLDFDYLEKLLLFQTESLSKTQDLFIDWLTELVLEKNINVITTKDKYGNLYITKGISDIYPCVVAHVDTAQELKSDLNIFKTKDIIFGFDADEGVQCGIGADDRCGVYFALKMLEQFDTLKVFLSKDEEVGCGGSKSANMEWFKDCSMLVQLDRRSYTNDIIEYTNGVQVLSEEFKRAIRGTIDRYNYEFNDGIYTDVGELKKQGVDCVAMNVSCGYVNEHHDDEIILINHFINAINLGYELILNYGYVKWEHITCKKQIRELYDEDYPTLINNELYSGRDVDLGTWHYCEGWKFGKEDEDYITDMTSTGTCPLCQSSSHEVLLEGEFWCNDCGSVFHIPIGKGIMEVEDEMWEIIEKDRIMSVTTKSKKKKIKKEEL